MEYKNKPVSFYVIYSFDICGDDRKELAHVSVMKPSHKIMKQLDTTEWNGGYEYDYMWWYGKHRKYVGLLSAEDFETFVDDVQLKAEDVKTMGSLTGMGLLPAISFNRMENYDECVLIGNAYVTPVIDDEDTVLTDEDWEPLRRQVIDKFS